ncbi:MULTISPECIES: hypothetical protein [unclassified Microbacterium]|uniref:hypothetical protein n=1 Tax=unclassified Microbacterium TaxID=2609290 RepID=UPI00342A5BE9
MNDTVASTDEQVRSFAAAVREHLDDLPADELDEIIGGLEADLADQAADNDGVLDLGDPAAYAAELRAAAGLPPRSEHSRSTIPLRERAAAARRRMIQGVRRSPLGAWVLDTLLALRPVWWVLRAFGLWASVALVIALVPPFPYGPMDRWAVPDSPLGWLALFGLVVLSVQWGRGRWLPENPLRHIRTAASIVALLMLPAVVSSLTTPEVEYVGDEYPPSGLMLDGVQINNIFAYDADGEPIEQVQLFTGKGTPLNLYGESGGQVITDEDYEPVRTEDGSIQEFGLQDDGVRATIPSKDYRGRPVWNVYPLDEADMDTRYGMPDLSTLAPPRPPFQKAPSVTPTPGPTPTPTP